MIGIPAFRWCRAALCCLAIVSAAACFDEAEGSGPAPLSPDTTEFHTYLLPETSLVAIDSLVEIVLAVDSTALHFNGFKATIQYEPALVSLDTVMEGSLMASLCENRFTHIDTTESTVTFTDILLCAETFADGPGELAIFKFRGLSDGISAVELVSDPDETFFDAGRFIYPGHPTDPRQVIFHNASIQVGEVSTAVPPIGALSPSPGGTYLSFHPNPFSGGGAFRLRLPRGGRCRLELVNVAGELVLEKDVSREAGEWQLPWNGEDREGRPLPGGIYFARLSAPEGTASSKIVILR